jgi:endonuclease YncB( thermonuclease family)
MRERNQSPLPALPGSKNATCRWRKFLPWFAGAIVAVLTVVTVAGCAWSWEGRVVKVLDGDTIEVLNCNDRVVRIHLYGVEAPRRTQYFGAQSARYFSALVHGKPVQVMNVGRDFLGRMRSMVWIDGLSVNEEMVRAGFAWVSNPVGLSPSCEKWKAVQSSAREQKAGMWSALEAYLDRGLTPDLPRSCPIF